MVRLPVVDLPTLPPMSSAPSLSGGARQEEFVTLAPKEQVLALSTLIDPPGVVLGTEMGVVKRVAVDYPANKNEWEVITLRDGDRVIGAVDAPSDRCDLVFVTTDAQLLRFSADKVRPQGRAASGVAGIALGASARACCFTAIDLTSKDEDWASVVVTVAGSSAALPGTQTGTAKVTPYAEFPTKGRATGGVRCHRFLRGEDRLLMAWVGPAPARAATAKGAAVALPDPDSRRDGSGVPLTTAVASISGRHPG
jgi:DNA gyrase subunit A